jgi:hypothetical protein
MFPLLQATKCGCFGQHRQCTVEETTVKKNIKCKFTFAIKTIVSNRIKKSRILLIAVVIGHADIAAEILCVCSV